MKKFKQLGDIPIGFKNISPEHSFVTSFDPAKSTYPVRIPVFKDRIFRWGIDLLKANYSTFTENQRTQASYPPSL